MVLLRGNIASYIDNVHAAQPAPTEAYRPYNSYSGSSHDPYYASSRPTTTMPRSSANTSVHYSYPYSTDRRQSRSGRRPSVSSYEPLYDPRSYTFRTSKHLNGPPPAPPTPSRSIRRRAPSPPPRKEVRFDDSPQPASHRPRRTSTVNSYRPTAPPPLPPSSRPTKFFDREAPPATISESARDTSRRLFKGKSISRPPTNGRPEVRRENSGLTTAGSMYAEVGSVVTRCPTYGSGGGSVGGGYVDRRRSGRSAARR